MIRVVELTSYLNDLLACAIYSDYAPNGLQIEGKPAIARLCTAVTASDEVISQAAQWQADALLVHHGYFWKGEALPLIGMKGQRVKKLFLHEMNLLAYHLPLDCHLELGNNACLAKLFAAQSVVAHKVGAVDNLLWSGKLTDALSPLALSDFLSIQLQRMPLHIAGQPSSISSIAWCSGGAQDYIEEAWKLGVDAYISGEVSERTYYQAKELGIHYYACGHHATERYGIQALGAHLAEVFPIEHLFIDSDNPV